MTELLEDRGCPQCASSDRSRFCRQADFSLWVCSRCGLGYTAPVLSENALHNHYTTRGHTRRSRSAWAVEGRRRGRLYRLGLRRMARYRGPGRLLDVGCSIGGFLAAAQEKGWSPVGIDLSKEDVAFVKTRLGFEALLCPIEETGFPDETFDAITFWDVFEHMCDPRRALRAARRLLRPGGLLVLRVPNFAFNRGRIRFLQLIRPPDGIEMHLKLHLNHFTPDTLAAMLESDGFGRPRIEAGEADLFRGRVVNSLKIAYVYSARALRAVGGPNLGNVIEAYVEKS